VEIIAHRGESHTAPENTLAAVELAWERGATAVEVDVRLSRDGQAVLMHDATAGRTGGVDRPVAEQTLAELQALDVGACRSPAGAGERIPLLADVLATVPAGGMLHVEVKCGPEVVPELKRVIDASPVRAEQVFVISFHVDVIAAAAEALPDCPRGLISAMDETDNVWRPTAEELVARAQAVRADELSVLACAGLDEAFVATVKAAGLTLCAWTIDDADKARRLMGLGVDLIASNRAAWLREQLGLPPRDDGTPEHEPIACGRTR